MFSPSRTYAQRREELCLLVDDMTIPVKINGFTQLVKMADNLDEARAYKLDRYTSTHPRNKKEVEAERPRREKVNKARMGKDDFKRAGQLGDGQFGRVTAVVCKFNSAVYAMKSIKKHTAQRAGGHMNLALERRLHLLARETTTPYAPYLIAAFQDDRELHLFTEYAPYGTLWDAMWNRPERQAGNMDLSEIKWWAAQMAGGIEWLHGQGYIHRDIKPHNFLIFPNARLKLTDFGSAAALVTRHEWHAPNQTVIERYIHMSECFLPVGTPDYIAPEVLEMSESRALEVITSEDADEANTRDSELATTPGYGPAIDWWSYGVTLYELAYGIAPFLMPTVRETYARIIACGADKDAPKYSTDVDSGLNSFLRNLLVNRALRLGNTDSKEITKHPFLSSIDMTMSPKRASSDAPNVPLIAVNKKVPAPTDFDLDGDIIMSDGWTDPEPSWDDLFDSSLDLKSCASRSSIPSLATLPRPLSGTFQAMHMSAEMIGPNSELCTDRWCGWTWLPPPSVFEIEEDLSRSTLKAGDLSMLSNNTSLSLLTKRPSLTNFGPFTTPARQTTRSHFPPTPRSNKRFRNETDRRAMTDLVSCVVESARKKANKDVEEAKSTRVTYKGDSFDMSQSRGALQDLHITNSIVVQRMKAPSAALLAMQGKLNGLNSGIRGLETRLKDMAIKNSASAIVEEEEEEEEEEGEGDEKQEQKQRADGSSYKTPERLRTRTTSSSKTSHVAQRSQKPYDRPFESGMEEGWRSSTHGKTPRKHDNFFSR